MSIKSMFRAATLSVCVLNGSGAFAQNEPVRLNSDAVIGDIVSVQQTADQLPGIDNKTSIIFPFLHPFTTANDYRFVIESVAAGRSELGSYDQTTRQYNNMIRGATVDLGFRNLYLSTVPGPVVSPMFVSLIRKLGLDAGDDAKWDLFTSGFNNAFKEPRELRENQGKAYEALMAGFKAVAGDGNDITGNEILNGYLADTYGRSTKTSIEQGIVPGSHLDKRIKEHNALPQNDPAHQRDNQAPAGVINPDGTITTVTPDGVPTILRRDQNGGYVQVPRRDPLYQGGQGTIAPRVAVPD